MLLPNKPFNRCRVTMKYKILFLLLTSLFTSSCSSIKTHDITFGHPYSGTEDSVKNFPCRSLNSINYALFPFPFIVLDMPLSFIIDTVLLPVDIFYTAKIDRKFTTMDDIKCI